MQTQPVVVGWSTPEDQSNGFVNAYTDPDIICHLGATNAQTSATVKAGGSVELQWTVWPESHHGPVIGKLPIHECAILLTQIDYLASCNGDCKTVDKTTLEFFKIDGVGLIDDTTVPGNWASDTLIANNNSWTVTIPSDIAPGNYVLRHEIIALHSAGEVGGAQNYPQCVNLEVTGSGTAAPAGVLGTALYTDQDPGILVNIYQSLSAYIVPGPTLYSGAISASQTGAAPVATSAPASSVASQVTSSAAGVITSAPSISGFPTLAVSNSGAPYLNTTSTKKSACKAKSSSTPTITSVPTNVAAVSTSSVEETFAASVTIPTVLVESTGTVSIPAATFTSTAPESTSTADAAAMPAGTTLSDLLSWVSNFYNKFKGTAYTGNTVARRHARDVARAAIEKFDRVQFAPTGTQSGFAHPTHHHHHPHGTGFARPTGFAMPTRGRNFNAAEFP